MWFTFCPALYHFSVVSFYYLTLLSETCIILLNVSFSYPTLLFRVEMFLRLILTSLSRTLGSPLNTWTNVLQYIRIVWTLWKRIWILFANMCELVTFHHGLLTILYDVTFPSFARTHECLFKVQGKTTQSNESQSMKVIFSTWCRSLSALKNV